MKQLIFFFLSVFLFSCGNNQKNSLVITQEKPELSIVKKHISLESIDAVFEKQVEDWQELKAVKQFIKKFENVSPNEALSNALELRDLVKSLKDSIKPPLFDTPSFNGRINVLHNETLRLTDLTLIPAITSQDVNLQVDKTISSFSAVNSKINTILSKKRFEEAMDFDIDYIGIDSTMMDSVSRKSIHLKREDELKKLEELKEVVPRKNKPFKKIQK